MTKQMDPTRRKQARHAQKAKMKRRRRQTGLIVTAVILAVAAAAGWFFLGDHEPGETRPVETVPPETIPAETQAPRPQTGTTVITIAAAGDLSTVSAGSCGRKRASSGRNLRRSAGLSGTAMPPFFTAICAPWTGPRIRSPSRREKRKPIGGSVRKNLSSF